MVSFSVTEAAFTNSSWEIYFTFRAFIQHCWKMEKWEQKIKVVSNYEKTVPFIFIFFGHFIFLLFIYLFNFILFLNLKHCISYFSQRKMFHNSSFQIVCDEINLVDQEEYL